jgi:hypothetical protein
MALAESVQRKVMWLTPLPILELLARIKPRFVISLLCHWLNEKNPTVGERFLAPRFINPVGVAKKMSQLSDLSILNLLRQDESLWQFYAANLNGGTIINLTALPYILLELMFDLGGEEGRQKVIDIIAKCRTRIGGFKQGQILKAFKTDTVLDIFEVLPEMEVNMIFKNLRSDDDIDIAAFWLNHWDLRMQRTNQPPKSAFWLGRLPGQQAFKVERKMRELEFRRKFDLSPAIFEQEDAWRKAQAPKAAQ